MRLSQSVETIIHQLYDEIQTEIKETSLETFENIFQTLLMMEVYKLLTKEDLKEEIHALTIDTSIETPFEWRMPESVSDVFRLQAQVLLDLYEDTHGRADNQRVLEALERFEVRKIMLLKSLEHLMTFL